MLVIQSRHVGYHYTQTNTNTQAFLQTTWGKMGIY
jgi:hypothetical protein